MKKIQTLELGNNEPEEIKNCSLKNKLKTQSVFGSELPVIEIEAGKIYLIDETNDVLRDANKPLQRFIRLCKKNLWLAQVVQEQLATGKPSTREFPVFEIKESTYKVDTKKHLLVNTKDPSDTDTLGASLTRYLKEASTFQKTGKMPETLKKLIQENHEIANHTTGWVWKVWLSPEVYSGGEWYFPNKEQAMEFYHDGLCEVDPEDCKIIKMRLVNGRNEQFLSD